MISAVEAIQRLREGNLRFHAASHRHPSKDRTRFEQMIENQEPFAVILGCSDSRVPAEIVFDQGLGDLFVIRVAGNIVAPSQVGSVEFAVAEFQTRLVIVLGHSHCGAVNATLKELHRPSPERSPNLKSIVDRIRPAVEPILEFEAGLDPEQLMAAAVRANIRAAANQLRHGSSLIENLIATQGLAIVGAEYCLKTGKVDFFDVPDELQSILQ
ncbi:MAG: carbonic anhydrase [Puniceicoccaceae bacterium]